MTPPTLIVIDVQLRAEGGTAVALVGLTTDRCCSTTARMALERI